MPHRLSESFGLSPDDFQKLGAFDPFVEIDAQYHIDPYLLRSAETAELRDSHATFTRYFDGILTLIDNSRDPGDSFGREIVRKLTFGELPHLALGYSHAGRAGSGIGPGLAAELAATATVIVRAGVRDPSIFELMGSFRRASARIA